MDKTPSKKRPAVNWGQIKANRTKQRRLLHLVAQWFADKKLSHVLIAEKIRTWVQDEAPECYNGAGTVTNAFAGRRIADAARGGFLQVARFYEEELCDGIRRVPSLPLADVKITVAPGRREMLQYAWLDLAELLAQRAKTVPDNGQIILGVSGGRTMLDFAKASPDLTNSEWKDSTSPKEREKLLVCSLTSGGLRENITALSDTVAAMIANTLGVNARGLLGPAYFDNSKSLEAFRNDSDVRKHKELADKADIILTSLGRLSDSSDLVRQVLEKTEESGFVRGSPDMAEMLYQCYHGTSGKAAKLPDHIAERMFSVISLERLRERVNGGMKCILLAAGKEKGRYALPGVLRGHLASDVYMDRACAEALLGYLQGMI